VAQKQAGKIQIKRRKPVDFAGTGADNPEKRVFEPVAT